MASVVARNYASALFELAKESNELDIVKEELNQINNCLKDNDELYKTLIHPSIEKKDKKAIFSNVFQDCNRLIKNTMMLLIDKNHLKLIYDINESFIELYREDNDIELAEIYSAKQLTDEELNEIKNMLIKKTNKKIEVKCYVNESLLAGVKVKLQDKVIDNTLINKIEVLRDKINKEVI